MDRFTFLLIISLILPTGILAQIEKQDFIILNKLLPEPDTVTFETRHSENSFTVRKIVKHHSKTKEEITHYKVIQEWGKKYLGDKRLFDGKILVHEMGIQNFLVSGDTLYQVIKGNRLSKDSLNVLFGNDIDPHKYDRKILEGYLQIIQDNNIEMKVALYHPSFFKENPAVMLKKAKDCMNLIKLEKSWVHNGKMYYAILADYGCYSFPQTFSYIIDEDLRIVGFEKKYISTEIAPLFTFRPYMGRVKY